MMLDGGKKRFNVNVGKISEGWLDGFGIRRITIHDDNYPQHYYESGFQKKYAAMERGFQLHADLTFCDKSINFASEIGEQPTKSRVHTYKGFCGILEDGSFVKKSFNQTQNIE